MKKKLITALLAAIMVLVMGTTIFAASGKWQHDGYGWWYAYDEGGYAASRWEDIEGNWYHFNSSGYMDTGWIYDGAWYFMNPDGTMATGWVFDGYSWYYFSDAGIMCTGWINDGDNWYYMTNTGTLYTGWIYDGAWYYLTPGGAMATGWIFDGLNWYYMGTSGAMQTGWFQDGTDWYYANANGVMQTGWFWDGAWYYLYPSGIMATGWVDDSGNRYYFDETTGVMVTGEKNIDGEIHIFGEDGIWQSSKKTVGAKAKELLKNDFYSYSGLVYTLELSGLSHEEAVNEVDHCGADWNEQAVNVAKTYLDLDLSYLGLVDALESGMLGSVSNFPHEQAVYGADHCGADWNEQAVNAAKRGLQREGLSYRGVIDFLEANNKQFPHEQAVYGADHCGADWNEQAVRVAIFCLEQFDYSYKTLISTLENGRGYDSKNTFPHEQAVYGADHCGIDWNEQAVKVAKNTAEMGYSYLRTIEELESENSGFTHEEAVYGADHCGANWTQNAVEEAKWYMELELFDGTYDDMVDFLENSLKFTHAQAEYAAKQCGL